MYDPENGNGSVEFGPETEYFRSKGQLIRNGFIALFLAVVIPLGIAWSVWPNLIKLLIYSFAFGCYCIVAYLVRPKPNYQNIGSFIGINRSLISLEFYLSLGRFITGSLVDNFRYLRTGKLSIEQLLDRIDK